MTLVRWRPAGDVVNLHDEMNRLFDEVWRRSQLRSGTAAWVPPVDLMENEAEFRLVAELPGIPREDVKISLTDNILTLRGEKKAQAEEKNESWHHVERSYGSFERSFNLVSPVDATKVKAKFENGLLIVTLPKSEESRPREIRIEG